MTGVPPFRAAGTNSIKGIRMPETPDRMIMDLALSRHSWEQILYHIVSVEAINPEDVDLEKLANGFTDYVRQMKEFDFHVPAKVVIIAAVLLRMKADKLGFAVESPLPEFEEQPAKIEKPPVDPLALPLQRQPMRKVTLFELVAALRKALEFERKKEKRIEHIRNRIEISDETVNVKIEELYRKIVSIIDELKQRPLTFKEVVGEWKRDNIVRHFTPLLHLAHQKKIKCEQPEMFEEIYITIGDDEDE